jgi:hypothetical protein
MNRHRITILIGLVAGATAALPAPALANPLLSGYGGPGQGNQAILGSALVNAPRSGGGGGAGGEGGAGGGSGSSGESSTVPTGGESESGSSAAPPAGNGGSPPGGSHGSPSRGSGARRVGGRSATGKHALHGTAAAAVGADRFYPAAERVPAGAQAGTLGLSGEDALLIALAVVALALVAGVMRRSTRTAAVGRRQ